MQKDEKSEARAKVEASLAKGCEARPMTLQRVTEETGLTRAAAQHHINQCLRTGITYRTNPGERGTPAEYVAGRREIAVREGMPTPRTAFSTELLSMNYLQSKPAREKANENLKFGSRRGDEVVDWQPPMLISSGRLEAVMKGLQ